MAVSRFCLSQTCSHSPALGFPSSRAGDGSALGSPWGGFTAPPRPAVPRSGVGCLPCSSRKLLKLLSRSECSALPAATAPVLWPRLTAATSIWSRDQGYRLRLDDSSPQVRTLTVPAALSHLLLWPLVAWGFVVISQLARPRSLMGFVCLKSQVCLRLPPDPVSRRRPCLQLTVGATNLRTGLSPASQRPCWAH